MTAFRKTAETFTAGAKTLPQRYFVSPEIFEKEQNVLFSARWVLVGHQSQIAKAGDYFVQEVAGESLIVVRDKGGEVRGFYNVCRHRGTRLCEDQVGHSSKIQCPYHAWTYGLDGKLIGVPNMDEESVPGFDKAEYSLHAVGLALWKGSSSSIWRRNPRHWRKCLRRWPENFLTGICRNCARSNGLSMTSEPIGS